MRWMVIFYSIYLLMSCRNGRDAIAAHQIIAAPCKRLVHWSKEEPVDVSAEKKSIPIKPCQQGL